MATTISTQDIVDAKRDIDDIGKAVNEKVIVSPRYGEDFRSLPLIAEEFQISSDAAEAAAVIAQDSAAIAQSSANIAEAAATAATISAGVFETPEAGVDPVTGVSDGNYFNVRSSNNDSYIDEYQNVGGVATPTGKSYPSSNALNNIPHNNLKNRDAAGAHPASAISYGNSNVASFLDNQDVLNEFDADFKANFVTPEMHGAKANDPSFDNTIALNAAFSTGKDVYSTPDKTYWVTGSIRTLGQRTLGGWKIHSVKATSRAGTWDKTVTTKDTGLDTSNNIRMLYVSSAWDLSEFLAIKALGFNTIHHYVGMSQMGWDWDGDVFDVLNNAMTAGLKVSLGTEQDPNAISDLAAWVASVDSYPALWAYSVYDEPVARGFTVAQQDARITTLRGLTNKKLITVDYESNPFVQKYSTNYDLVFVNSYSKPWSSGDLLAQDLDKFRKDYGVLKAQVKCPVVPCISAFGSAPETFYSSNVGQIIAASKIFGTIEGGNFAAFVWDGEADTSITSAVRDSATLQGLVEYLTNQPSRKPLRTDVYLFGNAETQTDWGLQDVINRIESPDSSATNPMNVNAYPIKIKQGATNTDRTSTTSNMNYAGIGFKGANARLVTTIELLKYLKLNLEYVNVDGDVPFSTIEFCSTYDGYDLVTEYSYAATLSDVIGGSHIISQKDKSSLAFRYTNTSQIVKEHYRQLLRGAIITTDW